MVEGAGGREEWRGQGRSEGEVGELRRREERWEVEEGGRH